MSNIPRNIKNCDLHTAFLNFLKRVINDNQQLLSDICQLKKSRKLLTYDPSLKSYLTPIRSDNYQDVY